VKINLRYIKLIALLALITIIANQTIWIWNMYQSYQSELNQAISQSLEQAIYMEFSYRNGRVPRTVSFTPDTLARKERYVKRTIESADTIFQVTIDTFDPYSDIKVFQYMLRERSPVSTSMLNSIFQENLSAKFSIEDTYIEYIDVRNNKLLQVSDSKKNYASSVESEIFLIDITGSLGVKAYVENPTMALLRSMLFQLILTIILIVICIICIIYLFQSVIFQRKEEKMRQNSINAMTHEFKRPISAAVAQMSLLLFLYDRGKFGRIRQKAESSILELNKLTAYTERIQRISNSNRRDIMLNIQEIEIRPFFQELITKYLNLEEKFVDISWNVSTSQKYIYVDLLHFSNVMDNLIENAIKYSEEDPTIMINISKTANNFLQISVKDNSIGLSSIEKRYIFDKFYRGTSKIVQSKCGFGLGLAYVKSIVEEHNGFIKVESQERQGCNFILLIPNISIK